MGVIMNVQQILYILDLDWKSCIILTNVTGLGGTALDIINKDPKELSISDTLKETIDSILKDTFEISDFKLVALSHEDKVWQMNYNEDDENHNIIIKREDILDEYTEKSFG